MDLRTMKEHGWLTGPVECCCSNCDWNANFVAVDSSVPVYILDSFETHRCTDYTPPCRTAPQKVDEQG